MDPCEVPRWTLLKASLSNLDWEAFINGYTSDTSATCLDVRREDEFKSGHFKNAIHLDYLSPTLADDLEALDKSKTYYIYCRTGRRSVRVAVLLRNMGFKVFNLADGLKDVPIDRLI